MNLNEAKDCFDKFIAARWPNWKPSEIDKADWYYTLEKYNIESVKKAMFQYVQNNTMYNQPKINIFIKTIRPIFSEYIKENYAQKDPKPIFWVVRKRDGYMRPIYPEPKKEYSPDSINRLAAKVVVSCEKTYKENYFYVISDTERLDQKYENWRYPVK